MINFMIDMQQKPENAGLKAIAVALVVTGLYLFVSAQTSLWDRDEPRFTRAVIEMMESGKYLTPTFNGEIRAHKPILVYWAMALAVKIFGASEFAFRFFSAVGTGICCLLTFYIGNRLLGPRQGLWAMLILASSTLMLAVGTMATSDGTTLPFTLGSIAVLVSAITSRWRFYHIFGIGILTGLGMLAKGPIGALPYPVIVITLWFLKESRLEFFKKCAGIGVAVIIGVAIFLAWAIPADIESGGEFLKTFIGKHVIGRAMRPMEHHGGNMLLYLPYYIPVVIAGFFPWIMILPGALSAVVGGRIGRPPFKILILTWTITIFVLMSLAATKLPHYIIFIWPALSLAAAGAIEAARQNGLSLLDLGWLGKGAWFFGPIAFIGSAALIIGSWFVPVAGLAIPAVLAGAVLLAMGVLAIREHRCGRIRNVAGVLLVGMTVFCLPYLFGLIPVVENQVKTSVQLADAISRTTSKDTPVVDYKYDEPSVNFYVGRMITRLRSPQEVVARLKADKPCVLIVPQKEFDALAAEFGPFPLKQIFSKSGFNYSKGKQVQLQAWLYLPENQ